MCVKPGALASALALRVERGELPSASELRALLGSGCTKDELRAALTRGKARASGSDAASAVFDRALEIVASL